MAKRALLFGINRYKVPGADLRGCVNDVENMKDVLTKYYDFPSNKVKSITDFRCTQARVKKEIEGLVSGAKSGDVLLLHYSGHGANVPDKSGDEADTRDEILCPTDLDWYDPLLDDWLRDVLDSLPKKVNCTVVMDCCHSGSNTREFHPPDAKIISRFLPNPLDLMAAESGRSLRGRLRSKRKKKKSRSLGHKDVRDVNIPEVHISGCRDDQTSADARIGGSYNGAMTYSLTRVLKAKKGNVTYRQLHAEMLKWLKGKYAQVPQLEGRAANLERKFLEPF